jgi:3-hydroxyisobutyrate dehydrogenase-like beta-hydroxyacid dehydrogenase
MSIQPIGFLHPGEMGVSIAASAINSGNRVYWASENRSAATHERAEKHDLEDVGDLQALCERSVILVCVCPPHAAENVAGSVIKQGFNGLYVDANAISPLRASKIGEMVTDSGGTFVDGSIIGGPAWKPGSTWLYLSGSKAGEIAACFDSGPLETRVIGETIGKASALKMMYAAYTKGTTALLSAILAAAEVLDVRDDLQKQWSYNDSEFVEQTARRVTRGALKAWRFAGEMEEIAATFEDAGLPGGFHLAASEIYRRLSDFKSTPTPPLEDILDALASSTANMID